MRPAVSIIVLVYGVEKYIERCARALFGQTMEDLEYIIVDDCSPDASMDILLRVLEEYPRRKDRVKVIRNEVNRGQAYSRRVGVEAATGEYIIHCDSDDWPEPDMYAKLYAKARAGGLDIVACRASFVFADRTEISADKLESKDLLGALIRQDILNHVWNKLVSRKVYEKGVLFPENNMCEDSAIVIQLASNSDSYGYLDEPLYNYSVREDGLSNSGVSMSKMNQMRENFNLAFSCLESKGLARKYKKDIVFAKCWMKDMAQVLPREYYLGVFPEVNVSFLFNKRISFRSHIGHLTHLLGIHGLSKWIYSKKKR